MVALAATDRTLGRSFDTARTRHLIGCRLTTVAGIAQIRVAQGRQCAETGKGEIGRMRRGSRECGRSRRIQRILLTLLQLLLSSRSGVSQVVCACWVSSTNRALHKMPLQYIASRKGFLAKTTRVRSCARIWTWSAETGDKYTKTNLRRKRCLLRCLA